MAYLSINESALNAIAKEGHKNAIAEYGDEDAKTKDTILYTDLPHQIPEIDFKDGQLSIDIKIDTPNAEDLAFISLQIPVSLDLAADIVEYYIKKLNRLKTVLEATKE